MASTKKHRKRRTPPKPATLTPAIGEPAPLPIVLSFAQIAAYLGMPLSTVNRLHRQGNGPPITKVGKRIFVREPDFRAWFDQLHAKQAEA